MVTRQVNFSITGEGLTTIAQQMVLSENVSGAWKLLTEGLSDGDSKQLEHYATKVLRGEGKFTGQDEIVYLDELQEEYQKELKEIYIGRFKYFDCWVRPKARVVRFGKDDFPSHFIAQEYDRRYGMHRERAEYYLYSGEILAETVDRFGYLICEPCEAPPFWWNAPRNATEALKEWLEVGNYIEERGYKIDEVVKSEEIEEQNADQELSKEEHVLPCTKPKPNVNLDDLKRQIWDRNGTQELQICLDDGRQWIIPYLPFAHWALGKVRLSHMLPIWRVISPMDLKLHDDDPVHTDWVIGAGLNFDQIYDDESIKNAIEELLCSIQNEFGDFECNVLVDGNEVIGTVGKDILVIPNLNPEHLEQMLKSKAVITQSGGRLAHLSQVALEHSIPVMLVKDAMQRFLPEMKLHIIPNQGKILHDRFLF